MQEATAPQSDSRQSPSTSLQYLIEAWPQLPPHVRETIVMLVDAALQDRDAAMPRSST